MTESKEAQTETASDQIRAEALREAGRNRTAHAVAKAEKAIRQLIKDGGSISFSSVARVGGISTKFLHQNQELAERIRYLSTQQNDKHRANKTVELKGESAIVAALHIQIKEQEQRYKKRITELRDENKTLNEQIESYLGLIETLQAQIENYQKNL